MPLKWLMSDRRFTYWAKSGLLLLAHQVIATEGVIWLSIVGTLMLRGFIRSLHESWMNSSFMKAMHLIVTNTPFFPVQIALGAYLGWRISHLGWRSRTMFWVCVLPGAVLVYAIVALPTISRWSTAETGPISHYLGWGCRADHQCYDQLIVTQPFYTSAAYSLGAACAFHKCKAQRQVL